MIDLQFEKLQQIKKLRKQEKKYKEIFKLEKMLRRKKIPYEFINESIYGCNQYHIYYPDYQNKKCSIIEGFYSYGEEWDTLEIQGLLTKEEREFGGVKGYLTAKEVFRRIKEEEERCRQKEKK